MTIIRFKHAITEHTFLVDPAGGRVYAGKPAAASISRDDQVVSGSAGGVRVDDLTAAARDFDALWKWPAPGTRFPPAASSDDGASRFPDPWFASLEGRLNQSGPLGDLEFRGFLDRVEVERLAAGGGVATERTALERHLSALDYKLKGTLSLLDLYNAFVATRLPRAAALKKAIGALVVFGRGRRIDIAKVGEHRPKARTGGFDVKGNIDPEILRQYRCLFDSVADDEIDQSRLERFNAINFQLGFLSKSQWQTFFATCTELNRRPTVTFKQLSGLFDGNFEYVAASRAGADGRRPLERVMPEYSRKA